LEEFGKSLSRFKEFDVNKGGERGWYLFFFSKFLIPPSRSALADEKVWFNSPELAPEFRVQGLPWGSYHLILHYCQIK